MCSGQLTADDILELTVEHHPLLEFADRYDMQQLKELYSTTLQSKSPLGVATAGAYRKLAKRYNLNQLAEDALRLTATNISKSKESKDAFLELDVEAVVEVLGRDDLALQQGLEQKAVDLARDWVAHRLADRSSNVAELLKSIRFDLMGFKELTAFVDGVDSARYSRL